jgi:dCMP deaminase
MGDCNRSQVGALIVGPDKRIWGLGYNGGRPGGPSCLDGACPRGRHYETDNFVCVFAADYPDSHADEHPDPDDCIGYRVHACGCGKAWPCDDAVEPGSSYDTGPGTCISTHAEANAKADAQRRGGGDLEDCRVFISREPCEGCIRMYRNETRVTLMRWPGGVVALP